MKKYLESGGPIRSSSIPAELFTYENKWIEVYVDQIESLLKALADQNRLKIMAALSKKKLCVCELAALLKITQPSVSKHLKKLRESHLIDSEQDGFWTNYYIPEKTIKNNKLVKVMLEQVLHEKDTVKFLKGMKCLKRESICNTKVT